jgi:hypothetical protein
MQKEDFFVFYTNDKRPVPSGVMGHDAMLTVSEIFHRLVVMKKWLLEVVRPIKSTIRLNELVEQIWPILNEINVIEAKDIKEYSQFVQKLEIDNFLSTAISKTSLNQYLEAHRVLSLETLNKEYLTFTGSSTIGERIRDLFWSRNIENYPISESVHLVQFYLQNI